MTIPANSIPAPTLQRLHTLRAEGLSLRDIAAQLYKDAIPPPAGRKGWNHVLVNECLEHPPPPAEPPSAPAKQLPVAAEQPPSPTEPPPVQAPQLQKIEDQLGSAVDQLSARLQKKLGTVESQMDERLNTLTRLSAWLWFRPAVVGVVICGALGLGAWAYIETLGYRIESQQKKLAELKLDIEQQQATVRELGKKTWGVGLAELENGRFLILPKGTDKTWWNQGDKTAVKLPDK